MRATRDLEKAVAKRGEREKITKAKGRGTGRTIPGEVEQQHGSVPLRCRKLQVVPGQGPDAAKESIFFGILCFLGLFGFKVLCLLGPLKRRSFPGRWSDR